VKKISDVTKPRELTLIRESVNLRSRSVSFFYGECFFELAIFSDGRFYLLSPIIENFNKQIEWSLRLRALIAKIVNTLWKYESNISFSALSITP